MKNFQLHINADNSSSQLEVNLGGVLNTYVSQKFWFPLKEQLEYKNWLFNLSALDSMDLNGAAQFISILDWARLNGVNVRVDKVPRHIGPVLDMAQEALGRKTGRIQTRLDFFSEIGLQLSIIASDFKAITSFNGELLVEMLKAFKNPLKIRWPNVLSVAETAGVNALPVVCLVSGLVGLIIAFQAAMLMKLFGAEIYVSNLIGISVVRELGPTDCWHNVGWA